MNTPSSQSMPWIGRAEQVVLAVVNLVALVVIGSYFVEQQGLEGRLIEVDANPTTLIVEHKQEILPTRQLPTSDALVDDPMAVVPERPSVEPTGKPALPKKKQLLVDLNTAPQVELMLLPGIGKVLSERIIAYREIRDGFQDVNELVEVHGIGPKTLAKLKPFLAPIEDKTR